MRDAGSHGYGDRRLSVFRSMKPRRLINVSYHYHQNFSNCGMRLTWPQHLQTARTLELTGDSHRGEALALMGVALLLVAQDLLEFELDNPGSAKQLDNGTGLC